ncbi:MAG: site-specific DNA-methyltransferase [Desulfomonilaceae bacterium]
MADIEKMPLGSMNITDERIEKLKQLFPECFIEGKVDFDKLQRSLGQWIEVGKERYGLNWPGKAECMRVIQTPSVGTLLPMREESINFNTTENLIIEGDNLEVLKLLQKSYFGKVKMIYIDPPYNTGNEFIYPDNYREGLQEYLKFSGQVDAEGSKLTANAETEGRFHSKWLSMMYPRLFLARNLLTEDGVIFVSIDDNEVHNLRELMNEVFGEENFVGNLVWRNATDNNPTNIATEHEYIICFAKNESALPTEWKSESLYTKEQLVKIGQILAARNKRLEELKADYSRWFKQNRPFLGPLDRYKHIDFEGVYTGSQSVHNPGREGYRYDVIHPKTGKPCVQPLMGYRFPPETMNQLIKEGKILFGEDETKIVEIKVYAKDYRQKLSSVIDLDGRLGAYDLSRIFPKNNRLFNNPKPVVLVQHLIDFACSPDDLVLDFFSGSATTADAVLHLNKEDGGNRKFLLVQLPEKTANPEYPTIAHIGRERVRRVIKKLNKEDSDNLNLEGVTVQDRGFKAFKLSSSNFKVWDGTAEKIYDVAQRLLDYADHIDASRSHQDILYELLLKAGFPLTANVEKLSIAGDEVYSVAEGTLLICLEEKLTLEVIEAMVDMEPSQILCLDKGFQNNDQLKVNAIQAVKSSNRNEESDIVFRVV